MMRDKRNLTMEMLGLTNQIRRQADAITARYGGTRFTGMQGFIIAFLYDSSEDGVDVYQRDIEREFYISRSTVSGILSLMEKNGLILRQSVPSDARLKKLVLTDEARQIQAYIVSELGQMDQQIEAALTPEERVQMIGLLDKIWNVFGEDKHNREFQHPPTPPLS